MNTKDEIVYYCEELHPVGALMLTGEWGCGKTFLIEHDWNRITAIEDLCGRVTDDVEDWEALEEELEGLIRDLSRLLKDDWERTKAEVSLRYWLMYKIKKMRWK